MVDNSPFLSCRIAVYTTNVSNPYLSSNHTRMCSRTPARNTHESTDHSLYIKIVCFSLCEPCSTPEIFEFQTAPPRDRVSPYFHLCSWNEMEPPLCSCSIWVAVCNWHAASGPPLPPRSFPRSSSDTLTLSFSITTTHHIWRTIVICATHGSIIKRQLGLTFESYLL